MIDLLGYNVPYIAPFVAFVFVFLGQLLRTVYPYLKKVSELETQNQQRALANLPQLPQIVWDGSYTLTLAVDIVLSFIGTMLFFSVWSPPDGTLFQVAIVSFAAGWGSQDIVNHLVG